MQTPTKRSYAAYFNVFHHTDTGDLYPALDGQDEWLLENRDNLVALGKPTQSDRLTVFFQDHLFQNTAYVVH